MRLPNVRIPRAGDAASRAAAAAPTPASAPAPTPTSASAPAPTPGPIPTPDPASPPSNATPPRQGLTGAGVFGLFAGSAGIAVTGINSWKDTFGKNSTGGSGFGPSSYAIGGGATLLVLAGDGATFARNGMRATGALLVVGGVAGAALGAIERLRAPKVDPDDPNVQSRQPKRFEQAPPSTPADLAGIELGIATVKTIDAGTRGSRYVSIYADPTASVLVPKDAGLEQAIAQARALSQGDAQNRSHAVVQTKDGAYAVTRLTGDLDQVDGRFYASDNKYDREFEPEIDQLQTSLKAIVGVERRYEFSGEAAAQPSTQGDGIPWITPQLPAATTSTPTPAGS